LKATGHNINLSFITDRNTATFAILKVALFNVAFGFLEKKQAFPLHV
jgi:hypothetical protein